METTILDGQPANESTEKTRFLAKIDTSYSTKEIGFLISMVTKNDMKDRTISTDIAYTQLRYLDWGHCYNVRDLGGLPIIDGGKTRWHSIIRSDILGRLSINGQQALLDYGVQTIIDLRSPQEAQKEPSAFTEQTDSPNDLTYLNLPLEKYEPHVSVLIMQAKIRAEVYCIILDHYPDMVANIMRAIIKASAGGIVIHCHAGKDRTGIISALLLSLVGVSREIVVADYAESQKRLWPLYEKIIAKIGGEEKADFWLKPTATAEMMTITLDHLDDKYNGVTQYLLNAAGLSLKVVDQLKNRLHSG